ncbi:MAG: alpha/beta hydrolase [Nevskiales bacterium]|nr:alpha/beta hydrolase [Nevskiales bacterium]
MGTQTNTRFSVRSHALRKAVRWLIKPILCGSASPQQRRTRLELVGRLSRLPLPRATSVEPTTLRGVAAEWIRNARVTPRRTVLYFHGGAYLMGSPATHREMLARAAIAWQAQVVSVDYRLAPEHPFPAAPDDALAAYRALLEQDIPAEQIVIAGDSAGGGLAVACALQARDAGLPMPAAMVLFSPWVDLAVSGQSVDRLAGQDDMLSPQALRESAATYLGGAATTTPLASPICADLHGLPNTLIQASDNEILLDDARRLLDGMHAAGSRADLRAWHGLWHVWQLFAGKMPEADAALREVAGFLEHGAAGP